MVTASAVPPAPTEEQTKRVDTDNVRAERPKNEDQDAMDVEQTSAYPPPEETTTSKPANEHHTGQPASTDRKDAEGSPHVH